MVKQKTGYEKARVELTLSIQAGGASTRMGMDKGLIRLGDRPLIEHVLGRTKGLADEVQITTNHPESYGYPGIRLVSDKEPAAGPLNGLRTALEAAQGRRVLLIGCDMPFVERPLVEYLVGVSTQAQIVIPEWSGTLQPMLALYSRTCLGTVTQVLANGEQSLLNLLPHLAIHEVAAEHVSRLDPDGRSFVNLNTPEDLAAAERMLGQAADSEVPSG